MMGMLVIF